VNAIEVRRRHPDVQLDTFSRWRGQRERAHDAHASGVHDQIAGDVRAGVLDGHEHGRPSSGPCPGVEARVCDERQPVVRGEYHRGAGHQAQSGHTGE
jgi:hypothetical protein